MAKKARKSSGGSCTRQRISFKTKRGKTVTFMGRPGGMAQAGGSCSNLKRSTAHLKTFKSAFKKAVSACGKASHKRSGKHGKSPFNTCIAGKL